MVGQYLGDVNRLRSDLIQPAIMVHARRRPGGSGKDAPRPYGVGMSPPSMVKSEPVTLAAVIQPATPRVPRPSGRVNRPVAESCGLVRDLLSVMPVALDTVSAAHAPSYQSGGDRPGLTC